METEADSMTIVNKEIKYEHQQLQWWHGQILRAVVGKNSSHKLQ